MTKKAIISFMLAGLFWTNFALANVIINEVAWMGTETSAQDEWIELKNSSVGSINLEGWILKSFDSTPEIQLSGTIAALGFYLLERTDDQTVPDVLADQIYSGALTNSGERLQLYDSQNNLVDSVDCSTDWFAGDNTTKQTMERTNGNWQNSQNPGGTPKAQNSLVLIEETPPSETPAATEEVSEAVSTTTEEVVPELEETGPTTTEPVTYPTIVLITELLPSPLGPDEEEEWIEIFNENATQTDISLWQITDTVGISKTYTFPEKTIIESHGFLVLYRPVSKITLNNDGDTLNLIQPDGNVIDTVTYEKAARGYSYSRTVYGWKWSNVLTPGKMNVVPSPKKEIAGAIAPDTGITTGTPTIEELAAIGEQLPKSSKPLKIFLIALTLAICGSILIFVLKKRLSRSPQSNQNNLRLPFK